MKMGNVCKWIDEKGKERSRKKRQGKARTKGQRNEKKEGGSCSDVSSLQWWPGLSKEIYHPFSYAVSIKLLIEYLFKLN
jgi:hypothetical protein